MLQQADRLVRKLERAMNVERRRPIDPSPTIDQAVKGGFAWLEIRCSRCKTPSDVDFGRHETSANNLRARSRQSAAMPQMRQGGRRPPATLLQLGWKQRYAEAGV